MALQTPNALYAMADKGNFALGAFNVYSLESVQAVLGAAENQKAPAIIQVSMGARAYVKDLGLFVRMLKMYAEACKAPVFIQHDHCKTIENCKEAIAAGVQAVMFDGSALPYEENVEKTRSIVSFAHERGVWIEAELGRIPGFEDTVYAGHAEFTKPEAVRDFIDRTGCDALAVSVGTSHGGVISDTCPRIAFDLLQRIVAVAPGYPFVLHGGASLPAELIAACNEVGAQVPGWKMCPEEDIAKAVSLGIRKVNMDVDNFIVTTTRIRSFLREKPDIYDPRKYLGPAYDAFRREVEHKFTSVLHSAGRWAK